MDSTVSVYSQIASCTTSDSDYTLNCEAIFKELGNNSKTYIKNFLTSITTIILDDTYPPLQQFLTLQLLAHATETKNQELIKQLANSKEFLNRLFHDAQYDYEEPLEEKGKCYFHDEPESTLKKLGKDYIRLVLEVFSYWSKEYGTPNTNDPLHCFYAVFTALCGKTQLPTTYKFITKNPQVRRYVQKPGRVASRTNSISRSPIRNNSRSPSPTSIIGVDVSRDESVVSMRAETNEAFGQLLNCVPSEQRYEKYSAEIFDLVERPSFDYNKKLLRAITALIKGTNYSWTYKFYTLYLLTQITETKDKVFVTQLVRESKLLNELYRQAKKKGRSDVKETAEEREYKRDFHKLTLEVIKFWHLSFGSSDINSPFYSFTYLYDMLKKDVKFPSQTEFQFIKARADRQSMSSIKLESRTSSRKTTKTAQDLSNDNDSIMRLVKTYISSGIAFRDDSSNIASILIKQPKVKSENYLQGTYKILNSIELKPNQRFYALYLLAITAEAKNNTFISALAESKTLLDLILKQALFEKNEPAGKRGSRLFSNRPSSEEAVIGSNYVQLAQETIRFLGRNYGVDNSRHPNSIFMTMAAKLEKEVSVDHHDHFVGKDLKNIDDNSMKKFEITPFHGYAQEHSQVRSSPVSSSLSKSKGQDLRARPTSLADLDKGLKDLNYAKTVLLSFLQDNERKNQENTDLVDNMVQDIADCYKSQVHPHLELLMNSSSHDTYKTTIYQEGKIVNDLDQLLIHYKTTRTSFAELRDRMIPLLATTTTTSQASSPSRLNRPAFLDTRLESSGLRMGMGALHNSDPVVHSPSSRFSRSPAKARTEVIRPVAVSDNDFLSRHEALLGRSNRRAETAHVPNKPSIGSIRSFDHHEIPFTESLTAVPEHRPVESLRAIEPFEKLSLAFDEKIKAAEQMRISRSSISQQPLQTDFQHNKRSSLELNYVSPNRSVIGGSNSYLFPENNRSYIKPSSLGSVAPPLETSMFVPGRSLYEVDHAARPQGSMLGTSGVRRFEGLGTTTGATQNPSYMHSKLGGITLGTKADSPVGRSYLFSNSVFGNRQNM